MVEIKEFYPNDSEVSIADVTIDEEVVEVRFLGSYSKNFTDESDIGVFLTSEALKKIGRVEDAKATMAVLATGENNVEEIEVTLENGRVVKTVDGTDTRNWAKVWIDKN
jgi:hypothetical protein